MSYHNVPVTSQIGADGNFLPSSYMFSLRLHCVMHVNKI